MQCKVLLGYTVCVYVCMYVIAIINPWHACTVRVTVLVLCVCVSAHLILANQALMRPTKGSSGFS